MRRMRARNRAERTGEARSVSRLPPEMFHVRHLPQTAFDRRGAVHARREQVHLQGRLHRQVPR